GHPQAQLGEPEPGSVTVDDEYAAQRHEHLEHVPERPERLDRPAQDERGDEERAGQSRDPEARPVSGIMLHWSFPLVIARNPCGHVRLSRYWPRRDLFKGRYGGALSREGEGESMGSSAVLVLSWVGLASHFRRDGALVAKSDGF